MSTNAPVSYCVSSARMDALLSDLLSFAHASSISEEDLPPVPALRSVEVAMENLGCSDSGKRGKDHNRRAPGDQGS